ncbi:H-NS family nucleoid-associated regulatory protein [Variovorax guangxiensis]|uniref:H-NS family nucleoid-associated regulatory protein n=1 Tax=Variovorax guangxiensis TaxID=1775474 RepID=UPI0028556D7C|nr:H-NS family nucleoid-associated regulatory protein [Variovorax guangxiensis]MDR6861265.1 DNA-binding protein H-NS [Variovorax guangxiensis]
MAQTYKQIQKQIEQLQRQADVLRHSEVKGVVDRIKVAIAHYGLTAAQLGLGTSKAAARPKKALGSSSGKSGAKFSDGNGNAWSGRGPRPSWLRDALTAGRSIDEFRVGSPGKSKPVSAELASGETAVPAARPARKKAKRTAKTSYKDDAGNSWSGFGPKPRWLKAALDAGKSLEDFAK